jgi:hypothetical protein
MRVVPTVTSSSMGAVGGGSTPVAGSLSAYGTPSFIQLAFTDGNYSGIIYQFTLAAEL